MISPTIDSPDTVEPRPVAEPAHELFAVRSAITVLDVRLALSIVLSEGRLRVALNIDDDLDDEKPQLQERCVEVVAQRKAFLLRIDPDVLDAVQRWANDDLRSLNGQIEFLLRRALADAGRPRPKELSREQAQVQQPQPPSDQKD